MASTPLFVVRASELPLKSSVIAAASFTADATNYYPVLKIHSDDRFGGIVHLGILIGGTGPLTGIKLTSSPVKNGTNPFPLLVDADWNTPSAKCFPTRPAPSRRSTRLELMSWRGWF